ncbi:MAG: type II toxin-antitoxin system RelE/ParE family toxin [Saprospiraceae bacterium]|nr:type II toxin-antitoxin system RelE/ParE family toxin [Saprospiraceae bacterium]
MVKFKVEWSVEARLDLLDQLEYYNQRNKTTTYSRKLYTKINKSINLISKNPKLGIKTDIDTVRALITDNYQIIYEIFEKQILIVMVWDCRRNPDDKVIDRHRKHQ